MNRFGKAKSLLRVRMNQSLFGRKILLTRSVLVGTQMVRKRIQLEAASINHALANSPEAIIRVVNDNAVSPPTYGNFFEVVMLARFFAASGCHVEFEILERHGRRADWGELDAISQANFANDQVSLARQILPGYTRQHMWPSTQRPLGSTTSSPALTVFSKEGDPAVYAATPYLLHVLLTEHKWSIPAGYLLDAAAFPIPVKALVPKQPYVAWHIRRSSTGPERNTTDGAIMSDFLQLREAFPRHSIMLFSTPNGVIDALQILSAEGLISDMEREGLAVVGQPETGFVSAIPWILGADFYFQRFGGGMGIVPIYSTMPYLQINNWESYYYGFNQNRLVPWAQENQRYVIHPEAAKIPIGEIVNTSRKN